VNGRYFLMAESMKRVASAGVASVANIMAAIAALPLFIATTRSAPLLDRM